MGGKDAHSHVHSGEQKNTHNLKKMTMKGIGEMFWTNFIHCMTVHIKLQLFLNLRNWSMSGET
jgi:hypothetical protein